jgi:pimeloyl-ACP methyl ester carboxylesterase
MAKTPPIHHRVEANGLLHHVVEWGAAGRPTGTALLVHGFMDAAGTWDLVAPTLAAAGVRVLAPDMRGFGEGARVGPGGYYHFPDYVLDVASIVEVAVSREEPLFVVGHSMGGTIATLFAGARPERVSKLALLEGVGPPDNAHEIAPDRMRRWLDDVTRTRATPEKAIASREDALRRLMMNHPRVDRAVLVSRLEHLVRDVDGGRVAWRFDPLHKTHAPMPFFAASWRAFAARITCPTLFVGGGPDGFHPPDEAERLACFPQLRTEEIANAGHMMHWTQPERLGQLLVEFWNG